MSSFLGALKLLWQVSAGRVLWVIFLMLMVGLSEGVGLLMLIPMLTLVGLETTGGAVGSILAMVNQGFNWLGLRPTLVSILLAYVAIVGLRAALLRAQELQAFALEQRFVTHMRGSLFGKRMQAEWRGLLKRRSSDFQHVLTQELERLGEALDTALSLVIATITVAIYLGLAMYVSWAMSLFILGCGLLVIVPVQRKARRVQQEGEQVSEQYEAMYAYLSDALAGLKTTKSQGLEAEQQSDFETVNKGLERAQVAVGKNFEDVRFLTSLASVVILSVVLYAALELFALSNASILLMIFLFARLVPMLSGLQGSYQALLADIPAAERVMHMRGALTKLAEPAPTAAPCTLQQRLSFHDVYFRYEGEEDVLQGVTLELGAGQMTAVVGSSGAGKSTLADLAIGLLEPSRGHISLDGVPLTGGARRNWRSCVGYVGQDSFIFFESVRANLLRAKPQAKEAALWEALELASAHHFVQALPEGLDTVLGDRGVRLSGGERQRLALARALLRQPSLIVLDEATSSLDAENERRIQQAIEALQGQQSLLVIAHRLATIQQADMIYVLEQGQVIEAGNWHNLMDKGGRFYQLCQAQGLIQSSQRVTAAL